MTDPDEQLKAEAGFYVTALKATHYDGASDLIQALLKALTDAETQRDKQAGRAEVWQRHGLRKIRQYVALQVELVEAKHSVRVAQESEDAVALNCKNWIEDYGDLELQLAEANRKLEAIRKVRAGMSGGSFTVGLLDSILDPIGPVSFALPCTCGWGGQHDPDNPRCDRNGSVPVFIGDTEPFEHPHYGRAAMPHAGSGWKYAPRSPEVLSAEEETPNADTEEGES